MEKQAIFCGNGKEVKFDDGGSIINMTVHLDKIGEHVYEYEGKKYVNLTIGANKGGANEYGREKYKNLLNLYDHYFIKQEKEIKDYYVESIL